MMLRFLLICWDWIFILVMYLWCIWHGYLEMFVIYPLRHFWENFHACSFENYWRRYVYFLNIYNIPMFYRFNRSRALQGRLVFIVRVSAWVWAKSAGFTQNKSRKIRLCPAFPDARGTCSTCPTHEREAKPCSRRMDNALSAWHALPCDGHIVHVLGTWCCFLGPNSLVFRRFRYSSSNNLRRNLGT